MTISQIVDTEAIYRVAVQQLQADYADQWSPYQRLQRQLLLQRMGIIAEQPPVFVGPTQPPSARS